MNLKTPETLLDGYKLGHIHLYPENTELIYSNFTARGSRVEGVDKVVFFGLQYFIKRYLIEDWNENFFSQKLEDVLYRYNRRVNNYLGPNNGVGEKHIRELHELGYLPIEIKALPEGSRVNLRVPMLTIKNTKPNFYWLSNAIETLLSDTLWLPCTSATTADMYKKLLTKWAKETGGANGFIPFQGHDFSMRGHGSLESACLSGAAHLLSFVGTDTVPAIDFLEQYYNADVEKELVAASVTACFDDQTEVLTNKGWKLFRDLDKSELIAQFNKDKSVDFVKPTGYFEDRYKGKMIKFSKRGYKYIDAIVTPNHKMVRVKNGEINLFEAGDFSYKNRNGYSDKNYLIVAGKSKIEGGDLTDLERLKIAFQADGSFPSHAEDYTGERGRGFPIRFSLKKERKKDRLIHLCNSVGLDYKYTKHKNGYYSFWINVPEKFNKDFSWVDLSNLSYQKAQQFIEELQFWDGHKPIGRNCICYSSVNKTNVDMLQGIAVLAEIKTQYSNYLDKRGDRQLIHNLIFQLNKTSISGAGSHRDVIEYDGYVYCVSVPSKMIIVRRNNVVLVCGNTEHSVASAGSNGGDDFDYFRRLITEVYPKGIISLVSDTFDFWRVIDPENGYLRQLKEVIENREGKVVIRPDSGDPVKIVTGWTDNELAHTDTEGEYCDIKTWRIVSEIERKGLIQCLYEIFGGTVNDKGFIDLSPCIGAIYGDSITLERAQQISQRLAAKGFSSTNIVYGIGSFTYQGAINKDAIVTRDTYGFAVKATYAVIDGTPKELFKDPVTDDGLKKSAKGLLRVDLINGEYVLKDQCSWEEEAGGELKTVFCDGKLIKDLTLAEIRDRLNNQ